MRKVGDDLDDGGGLQRKIWRFSIFRESSESLWVERFPLMHEQLEASTRPYGYLLQYYSLHKIQPVNIRALLQFNPLNLYLYE